MGVGGALALLFPPICVHCRTRLPQEGGLAHLCPICARSIHRVRAPHCPVCGLPHFGDTEENRLCPHCEELDPAFGSGCTAVLMKGAARSLVMELKYHRGLHVLPDLESLLAESAELLAHVRDAVLVPVPLHSRKLRERGYNQSRLLADALARRAGGRTRVQEALRRIVDTESQTRLSKAERRANPKNAFALAPGAELYADHRYVLVDDVFTTGSTLDSCAQVLRRAGCRSIDVVTFGHG